MASNKIYWSRKNDMASRAIEWYFYCKKNYYDEIANSVSNSDIIYNTSISNNILCVNIMKSLYNNEINLSNIKTDTNISIIATDTVSALFDTNSDNICILNFASFKNPGGMFLNGSIAQEESLCHQSILFNVLENFKHTFYNENKKNLNNGLYNNNLIYSKDILFIKDDNKKFADVITCASPNRKFACNRYNISDYQCYSSMYSRIYTILASAKKNHVKTLILGAYGCGVFGNDPNMVACIFKFLLLKYFNNNFENVIFAIPINFHIENYDAFKNIFDNQINYTISL